MDLYNKQDLQPFYITFGSASHFPYGINDYVVSYAQNEREASEIFRKKYPDAHEGLYNYSFIYTKDEWENGVKSFYTNGPADELVSYEKKELDMQKEEELEKE